jgi:hypothetical protein
VQVAAYGFDNIPLEFLLLLLGQFISTVPIMLVKARAVTVTSAFTFTPT